MDYLAFEMEFADRFLTDIKIENIGTGSELNSIISKADHKSSAKMRVENNARDMENPDADLTDSDFLEMEGVQLFEKLLQYMSKFMN